MTAYRPHLSAQAVDRHLRDALEELRQAEKNAVLWFAEVMNRKLYRELGHSSIHQYAALGLGFGKAKISQFIQLSGALEALPALKQSLARNELSWTKAREITRVATAKTEKAWIQEAQQTSRRELEQKVRAVRKLSKQVRGQARGQGMLLVEDPTDPRLIQEVPIDLHLRMLPEQFARYEAMTEKLRKLGIKGSTEELIIAAMETLVGRARRGDGDRMEGVDEGVGAGNGRDAGKHGSEGAKANDRGAEERVDETRGDATEGQGAGGFPRGNMSPRVSASPYQVVVNACPGCGEGSVETSRGPREISQVTLQTILCDARIKRTGEKNRSSIPPAMRMEALMRDRFRCQARGCGNHRFLNVHHIIPRETGGPHELDNLTTRCWGCHHVLHELAEKRGQGKGKTPEGRLAGIT